MWDSVQELASPIQALFAALKARDPYTAQHSDRTTALAGALGKRCGLSAQQLEVLYAAACVHDIGKIGIPDAVLLKPGELDGDEWELMKRHSEIGSQMLASVTADAMQDVVVAVRHHHEGYDGMGYPDRLVGENIPYLSRLICLADSYDAMATPRPYHRARDHAAIMTIMQGSARAHYDPRMLGKFAELIEESPWHADRVPVN